MRNLHMELVSIISTRKDEYRLNPQPIEIPSLVTILCVINNIIDLYSFLDNPNSSSHIWNCKESKTNYFFTYFFSQMILLHVFYKLKIENKNGLHAWHSVSRV